jgi:hypothetical protein
MQSLLLWAMKRQLFQGLASPMTFRSMLLAATFIIATALPAIAQSGRATLVEWDDNKRPSENVERRAGGSVVWRTEYVKSADGQDETLVRADVDIPSRNLKLTMSVRRNLDPSVHASHLIEMKFTAAPDYAHSGLGEVFGVFISETGDEKHAPEVLQGTTAKTNVAGVYVAAVWDTCKNLALMKDDPWLAVYFRQTLQPTAYLLIEKGQAGQQAFDAAFAAWEKGAGTAAKRPACPRS